MHDRAGERCYRCRNATIVPLLSETMSLWVRAAELARDRALDEGASAQSRLQQAGHGVTSKEVRIPIS